MRTDHIKPRTMRYFVMLADGHTVGETAKAHGVSSPCVTTAVHRTEFLLDCEILERSDNGRKILGVTESGQPILHKFRRVLVALDDGMEVAA